MQEQKIWNEITWSVHVIFIDGFRDSALNEIGMIVQAQVVE